MSGTILYPLELRVLCSNTFSFRSPLILKCGSASRNLPLKVEWPLSLCPPSSFSLRRIHAFTGTFDLLAAAFLGNFAGYIHLLRDLNLLADAGTQCSDRLFHPCALLDPLFNNS